MLGGEVPLAVPVSSAKAVLLRARVTALPGRLRGPGSGAEAICFRLTGNISGQTSGGDLPRLAM